MGLFGLRTGPLLRHHKVTERDLRTERRLRVPSYLGNRHLFGNLATRRDLSRPRRAHGFASPPCDEFAFIEDVEATPGLNRGLEGWFFQLPRASLTVSKQP